MAGRDSGVNGGFHFLPLRGGFGPGFCEALTSRPLAMSFSVQRHSIRLPPIGKAKEGRIRPRNSQRFRVRKDTPIFLAACCVLQVFLILRSLARLSSRNKPIIPAS